MHQAPLLVHQEQHLLALQVFTPVSVHMRSRVVNSGYNKGSERLAAAEMTQSEPLPKKVNSSTRWHH